MRPEVNALRRAALASTRSTYDIEKQFHLRSLRHQQTRIAYFKHILITEPRASFTHYTREIGEAVKIAQEHAAKINQIELVVPKILSQIHIRCAQLDRENNLAAILKAWDDMTKSDHLDVNF